MIFKQEGLRLRPAPVRHSLLIHHVNFLIKTKAMGELEVCCNVGNDEKAKVGAKSKASEA